MNSDTPLDYALFQLSPRRSRCELFVSGDGKTEKLASGFLKPFVTHLKVAEEQFERAVQSIKLEVDKLKNASTWFSKGTLERFVRFVSTPEVLELVNTFDAEMSQLEGARRIYSQGTGDQLPRASSENETAAAAAADATKKELLRAIDVRLTAVNQDLTMACARASAAGFTFDNVSELLLFADRFGANRLNEACSKFISLSQRRPELISHQRQPPPPPPPQWKGFDDRNVRSSSGSDMSIDEPEPTNGVTGPSHKPTTSTSHQPPPPPPPQPEPSATCQQPEPISRRSVEKGPPTVSAEPAPGGLLAEPAQPAGKAGSRRLSVQDRINMFENKQKEQSTSSTTTIHSTSSGNNSSSNKAGKAELRRISSDVSVEKSVLRRWSGASDMSIDLNSNNNSGENRKETASSAATPTSSSANSQTQSGSKLDETEAGGLKDTAASSRSLLGSKDNTGSTSLRVFSRDRDKAEDFTLKEDTASRVQSRPVLEKEQSEFLTQSEASSSRVDHVGLIDQAASQTQFKTISGAGLKDRAGSRTQFRAVPEEHFGVKDQAVSQTPSGAISAAAEQIGVKDQQGSRSLIRADGVGVKDQPTSVNKFRRFPSKTEDGGAKAKGLPDSQIQVKDFSSKAEDIGQKSGSLAPQSQRRNFPGKAAEVGKKDLAASQPPHGGSSTGVEEEGSGLQEMMLHRQTSAPHQIKNYHGRRDERVPAQGNGSPNFPGKNAMESVETFDPAFTSSMDQVQVVRPSKGNQELNDELQKKANELEKLFAAQKLRFHGDQVASSRRSKPADVQVDYVPRAVEKRPAEVFPDQLPERNLVRESSSNGVEYDGSLLLKMVDDQVFDSNMKQKLGDLSHSDEYRGKFYEMYMQKRDAKLREEWGSKRAQKEAKMKAMQDSLERSRAEMKAKFAGSADRQDLALHARQRAEKLRSFNVRSSIKNKEQIVESLPSEEEDDLQEFSEQVHYGQHKSSSETLSGDGFSRSINSKKLLSSRSVFSSTPRTSVAPIPRPSGKATSSGSIRRRTQPENPLAQSVPNFSDFRKENTKPSTGISKVTTRAQSRNFSRSKSTSEEINLVKEENPRRSQSMRKSSSGPGELKDLSPLNSDSANLTPLRFSKEQTEQTVFNRIPKSGESKSFLRKGNGIGPGAGAGIAKLKASMASDILKSEEESEGVVDQQEDSPDMVKDEEEFEEMSTEGTLRTVDFPVDSESEKPRLSQESGDSGDPGSENGDVLGSFSQAEDDSAAVSSKFSTSAGIVQESPGESPVSWNSRTHHSFSYAHEASDIDASVDSPTGSPASWNSHPLNQMMEADAARMRKKWGSAQKPILVANTSHQSRKDMTKGFKRLLKFGRKGRGAESLVNDWVSASTASEGDDDTEDGRDMANRSSDDLRKSRMGYSIPAYDGFNEGEIFSEQVQSLRSSIPTPPANFKLREDHLSGSSLKAPRSFFSLSSFRSKGSESKLR